jgi:HEAT repeat protein
VSWDYWWARNRYQFLDFPSLEDGLDARFPVTPRAGGHQSMEATLNGLRAQSISLMRPYLDHASARMRRAAVTGLAMLNDGPSLPKMKALLQDGNQTVRDAAVIALGILKNGEAKHTLLHMVRGTRAAQDTIDQASIPDYFRGFAEVSLALSRAQGIDALLRSIAQDPGCSDEVRAMALEGIGLVGGEDSAMFLVNFAEKNTKDSARLIAAAVTAAGKTKEPILIPFLEKSLLSEHLPVRQSAALALGFLAPQGDAYMVDRLIRVFRHSNDQALKGFSVVSIGMIGGPSAVELLEQIISQGRSSECSWACLGLGFALRNVTNDKAMAQLMLQAMTHANRSTRGAAVVGLGLAKCQGAVADLIKALKEGDDPIYRGYCALALGMIGDPKALGPLREAVRKDDLPQVKIQAALALALMRDRSCVDDLIALLLDSTDDSTKGFVALSLGLMGEIKVVDRMNETLKEGALDDITLQHCLHLTCKLLSGLVTPYLDRLAAGSNFASEYPMVGYLLDFGI